ncbi:MAG: hypothetical protein LAC66_03970 [Methylotenera sp.]|jgi:Tfp pilus assembly protein PilF|nr:hypothetical protein [Methylotenera sp.]
MRPALTPKSLFLMLCAWVLLAACTTQPENFNDKRKERAQAHADLGAVYLQRALQLDSGASMAAYQLAAMQFNRKDALTAKKTLQTALLSKASAEMLWLAIQIERELGDADLEASYALELKRNYPESAQAQLLQGTRP